MNPIIPRIILSAAGLLGFIIGIGLIKLGVEQRRKGFSGFRFLDLFRGSSGNTESGTKSIVEGVGVIICALGAIFAMVYFYPWRL